MHIVVGYHQAPEGRAALERARAEAHLQHASLHAINVLRSPTQGDAKGLRDWGVRVEQAREEASALERQFSAEGLAARVEVQTSSARSPAEILTDAAEDGDADLLVIGIRSRSRVGKLILGSVAQEVLMTAECPVLTVKHDAGSVAVASLPEPPT